VHLSTVSNRLNEVMRVLTVISTIFMPLTFIVGVYGMNFDYFPELHWRLAYPLLWCVMIGLALVMFAWFRRLGWIGTGETRRTMRELRERRRS
jgi:magnesium transporter